MTMAGKLTGPAKRASGKASATHDDADIAIIGMAGLYPQADDIDIFWANILARRDCVSDSPDDWLNGSTIYDAATEDLTRIYTRRGGFLGDLARFDARRFGTMPLSVSGAQPDQFLALKIAQDALEDAGYAAGKHDHKATGVILGHSVHMHRANSNGIQQTWIADQTRHMLRALHPDVAPDRIEEALRIMQATLPKLTKDSVPGLVPNVMTGRICNRLDLMGPNYIIDAACSSSIIAVDLAISELRAGRADMMLAGGVNTTTSPLVYGVFCSVDALSRNGRIRPFDSAANGTVLGEGAGIVVLKRLADALRDEDRIHAVIKGVGQSSDGKSSGLMAPRLEGEVLAIQRAYAQTGIDPSSIGLIEAHGTGIPLGDRTEVDALRTVFGARNGKLPTVPIGSVKSMIGHCIPASGSAAIIKMAFALSRQVIPPMLCDEVSGDLGLAGTPFHVATEARPWFHSGTDPRRAAINAFGFGGINAHMILEESPVGRSMDPTAAFMRRAEALPALPDATLDEVYVFAGADKTAILAAVDDFAAEGFATGAARARATWDRALTGGPARLAIVASGAAELEKKIGTVRTKLPAAGDSLQTRNGIHFEARPTVGDGAGKVAFLFPGEMGQYPGMMRDAALAFPEVRAWFDFVSALTHGRRDVALHDVMHPPATLVDEDGQALLDSLIHRVDYGSEMVFAADQAVFSLLTAMGIRPDAMLGHSTGENAAIVASGLLGMSRDQVGDIISQMIRVFAEIEASGAVPSGALLNIAVLDRPALERLLADHPQVHFTMDNCPNQAIVFGTPEEIEVIQRKAVALGAVCTLLPISWGYHTSHVAPLAHAFGQIFDGIDKEHAASDVLTLYSCATAEPFPTTRRGVQDTAVLQYSSRVRFTDAVERLYADGVRVFVECGPNAMLSAFVRDILGSRPHLSVSTDNRRRGMVNQLHHVAAQVFVTGAAIDPRSVLMPDETEDATRRRLARELDRTAPPLASALPYVSLEGDVLDTVRALLRPDAPAAGTGPLARPPTAPVAEMPAVPPVTVRAAAPRPTPAEGRRRPTARQVTPSGRIDVLDLTPFFHMPFAFRATLMRGAPGMSGLWPYLAPDEQAEAASLDHSRLPQWGLARLAVKHAARGLLGSQVPGQGPEASALSIIKDAQGAPYLRLAGLAQPQTAISLAHVGDIGIGIVAETGWRVGIDYDRTDRIRDAAGFLDAILSASERGRLALPTGAEAAVIAWTTKEAAAKALGLGVVGRPQDFALTAFDAATGRGEVSHNSGLVQTQVGRLGQGFCAVAHIRAQGGP